MAAACRESPLGSGRAQPWLPEVASVNLLLAVAGDGVELRADPVCGPVSTALQVGEYQFAAGAWASCRGWVIMASPLASWEEGGGGTRLRNGARGGRAIRPGGGGGCGGGYRRRCGAGRRGRDRVGRRTRGGDSRRPHPRRGQPAHRARGGERARRGRFRLEPCRPSRPGVGRRHRDGGLRHRRDPQHAHRAGHHGCGDSGDPRTRGWRIWSAPSRSSGDRRSAPAAVARCSTRHRIRGCAPRPSARSIPP